MFYFYHDLYISLNPDNTSAAKFPLNFVLPSAWRGKVHCDNCWNFEEKKEILWRRKGKRYSERNRLFEELKDLPVLK